MLGETILPPAALSFILQHSGEAAAERRKGQRRAAYCGGRPAIEQVIWRGLDL